MSDTEPSGRFRGGQHGYGCKADPAGHVVTSARHLISISGATPKTARIERHGILDQGWTSSCVGHAIAAAIYARMKAQGAPIELPSPIGIYTLARCIDRFGPKELLADDGSMPNQGMRGLTEWGVESAAKWGNFPANINTINEEPDLDSLEDCGEFKLTGYYRIDATGSARVDAVRSAIAQKFPVCFAIDVDTAFEAYSGHGTIGAPDPSDLLGGHYLYAHGYDTLTSGKTVFDFANSWSEDWGDAGEGHGDESFLRGWRDVYVMNVKKAA